MHKGIWEEISLQNYLKKIIIVLLLATKSFFTGIDIPGQSLRCIVIDKLPFTSPGDPV